MSSAAHGVEDGNSDDLNEQGWFLEEVTESWGDSVLMACVCTSGLLDAAIFNVWSCFTGMQTGNTVYAALGISGQPVDQPYRWIKSLASIIAYIVGCFVFSRVQRWCHPLRRATLAGSFAVQAVLCIIPAILSQTNIVPNDAGKLKDGNLIVLVPLCMLAFQAGGQTVISRVLGFNEIPTVVLTSTYCDLVIDPKLITATPSENHKRNRRIASVLVFFGAAVLGGFLTKGNNLTATLWIAGAIKAAIATTWLFWKAKGSVRLE